MRKTLFLAILCLIALSGLYAQTPLLTENWENGIGGWQIVNHATRQNKWHIGTATATGNGTHAMYISNDSGATNAYTIAGQPVRVHFYRDIAFPAYVTDIVLNLDIKSQGEGIQGYDYVRVYLMPTDITPVASNTSITANTSADPNAQYRIGSSHYNQATLPSGTTDSWNNIIINIPDTWSGQTGRLVFTWNNDDTSGWQPPAAIDNISITFQRPVFTVSGLVVYFADDDTEFENPLPIGGATITAINNDSNLPSPDPITSRSDAGHIGEYIIEALAGVYDVSVIALIEGLPYTFSIFGMIVDGNQTGVHIPLSPPLLYTVSGSVVYIGTTGQDVPLGGATIIFENVDGDSYSPSPITSAMDNGTFSFRTVYGEYNVTVIGEVNGDEYIYTSTTPLLVNNNLSDVTFTMASFAPPPFMSSEDWESDTSDWVIVNHPTVLNKWHLGEATHNGTGSHAMYISNDGGVTNTYTLASQIVRTHFYRDMTFPADVANIVLNFDIKVQGESNYDYVRVYMMPTSITPAAANSYLNATTGTDPHAEYIIGNYYSRGTLTTTDTWNNVNISIPTSWAGRSGRLVFTWNNDGSGGTQPPAAIDNLSITYQPANTAPGPATFATPYNAGNLISVDTALSWNQNAFSTPASQFILFFGNTPESLSPVYTGEQTSYTPEASLNYATTYYWRVVPTNTYGVATDCPVWSFTTIGETTQLVGSGSISLPYFPASEGNSFSVSEMIYTQEELAEAGFTGGSITHISFQAGANGFNLASGVNNSWLIYMGTTQQEAFTNTLNSWVPVSNMTEVKRGAISTTSLTSYQWVTITLDTPYTYEGNGNLVIFVNEYVASYSTGVTRGGWLGFSGTGNKAIYRYASGTEPFEPAGSLSWNTGTNVGGNVETTRPNLGITSVPLSYFTVGGSVVYYAPEDTNHETPLAFGGVNITITNATNGLIARTLTSSTDAEDLGEFDTQLPAGEYGIDIYELVQGLPYIHTSTLSLDSNETDLTLIVTPATLHTISGIVMYRTASGDLPLGNATVTLTNVDPLYYSPPTVNSSNATATEGEFTLNTMTGFYNVTVIGTVGDVTYLYTSATPLQIARDLQNVTFVALDAYGLVFSEDWESGTAGWTIANNSSRVNKWHHGTAVSTGTGTNAMYPIFYIVLYI